MRARWVTTRTCRPRATSSSRSPTLPATTPSDPGVDFVEDERGQVVDPREHRLEHEHHPRQLATRRDPGQEGLEENPGVHGGHEAHALPAGGGRRVTLLETHLEARAFELPRRGKAATAAPGEPVSGLAALPRQPGGRRVPLLPRAVELPFEGPGSRSPRRRVRPDRCATPRPSRMTSAKVGPYLRRNRSSSACRSRIDSKRAGSWSMPAA